MSAAIPLPSSCCSKCGDEIVSQVPGPPGPSGTNGTNGTNGVNGYALTNSTFTMPLVGSSIGVTVDNPTPFVNGQIVYIGKVGIGIGYFLLTVVSGSILTIQNLGYPGNSTPGTLIATGMIVTAGGLRGPTGSSGVSSLNAISPTTTKGDLIVDNGSNNPTASDVRLAVGSDGQVLTSQSSQGTGLQWQGIDLTGATSAISGALPLANGGTGQTTKNAALNALSNATTAGDILYYNGSNLARLGIGTALQILRTNAGATAPEWATTSAAALQMVSGSLAAYSVVTSTIPYDDTIPQNTEGTQLLSISVTPSTLTSRFEISAVIPASSGGGGNIVSSLFINSTADSFSAISTPATLQPNIITMAAVYVPGTFTTQVIALRIGSDTGANVEINGVSARKLGGVQKVWLICREYA